MSGITVKKHSAKSTAKIHKRIFRLHADLIEHRHQIIIICNLIIIIFFVHRKTYIHISKCCLRDRFNPQKAIEGFLTTHIYLYPFVVRSHIQTAIRNIIIVKINTVTNINPNPLLGLLHMIFLRTDIHTDRSDRSYIMH